jgi:hypothetical protein
MYLIQFINLLNENKNVLKILGLKSLVMRFYLLSTKNFFYYCTVIIPATRPNSPVNVYVDLLMLRELFDQTDEEALDSLMFEELRVLLDGAYYSKEISKKAEKNNIKIKMIPTNLVGRNPSSEKNGYEQFDIDETSHIVNACSMLHAPTDSKFKKQVYRAHFSKELCTNCPHRPHCPVSEQKKQFLFEVSETKLHCPMLRTEVGTAEYKEIASKIHKKQDTNH